MLQKGWALVGAETTLAGQKLDLSKDARGRSHLRQHGNKTKTNKQTKKKISFAFL